jgi:hypothetical protein
MHPWHHLQATEQRLVELPPLMFVGEARKLEERLSKAAMGCAFLLQGGDYSESFEDLGTNSIHVPCASSVTARAGSAGGDAGLAGRRPLVDRWLVLPLPRCYDFLRTPPPSPVGRGKIPSLPPNLRWCINLRLKK